MRARGLVGGRAGAGGGKSFGLLKAS